MKKRYKKFIFHKSQITYERRDYKTSIMMDNHEYYLFKNPHCIEKWWIADSETGLYVCRAELIDEVYDKLNSMAEKLQNIFKTDTYKNMKESYLRILELIERGVNPNDCGYSLEDANEKDYRD